MPAARHGCNARLSRHYCERKPVARMSAATCGWTTRGSSRISLRSSGLHSTAHSTTRTRTFSRRGCVRVMHRASPSEKIEGAGNAGCTLHPRSRVRLAHKEKHTSIQVQRRQSRHPLRNGFTAYIALSSGTGLSCPRRLQVTPRRLSLSVGRPGPHGFAVRKHAVRLPAPSRPPHSGPTFRDDA